MVITSYYTLRDLQEKKLSNYKYKFCNTVLNDALNK